jgi:hypothetical protein
MTVKQQLVDRMIAKGNSFTYTEMIKELLKIKLGEGYRYNWKYDRGYYSTNFSSGSSNGYMVNGSGDCGVYKGEDGKWHAKYYTKEEKLKTFVDRKIKDIIQASLTFQKLYNYEIQKLDAVEFRESKMYWYLRHRHKIQKEFMDKRSDYRARMTKQMVNTINKIK